MIECTVYENINLIKRLKTPSYKINSNDRFYLQFLPCSTKAQFISHRVFYNYKLYAYTQEISSKCRILNRIKNEITELLTCVNAKIFICLGSIVRNRKVRTQTKDSLPEANKPKPPHKTASHNSVKASKLRSQYASWAEHRP